MDEDANEDANKDDGRKAGERRWSHKHFRTVRGWTRYPCLTVQSEPLSLARLGRNGSEFTLL